MGFGDGDYGEHQGKEEVQVDTKGKGQRVGEEVKKDIRRRRR